MSDEKTRGLRSNFLVHWTGKDIQIDYGALCDAERQKYIQRLHTTLSPHTGGLWMNEVAIDLYEHYRGGDGPSFPWPATCFTETKLSEALEHTRRYGCLGFGFDRGFVMERFGAPVQYVAGPKEIGMGAMGLVPAQFLKLLRVLFHLEEQTVDAHDPIIRCQKSYSPKDNPDFMRFIENSELEKLLLECGYDKKDSGKPWRVFNFLKGAVLGCAIYMKHMSDDTCCRPFELLDEAEWRIPYTDEALEKDKLRKTDAEPPEYLIPFTQTDLRILILPDRKMREQALSNLYIKEWLSANPAELPIIVTVEECLDF